MKEAYQKKKQQKQDDIKFIEEYILCKDNDKEES